MEASLIKQFFYKIVIMNPIKLFMIFSMVMFRLIVFGQQEQMYTQYMFNKMGLNPAYAGNERYTGFTAIIRDQWNGFPGAPEAQLLSVNLPRINNNIGLGFNLRRQTIGVSKSTSLSGIYSYKFLFGDVGTLSMGLEVSGKGLIMDFTDPRLIASQGLENDPSIPNESVSKTLINVGYGLYFNTNRFYLGASVPRIIKSDLDFDNNNIVSEEVRHLFLMGGIAFPINRKLSLTTQSLLKFSEQAPIDADLSLSLTLDDRYTAGLSYRLGGANNDIGESIDLLFSFNITDQLMVGFSQDFTLSSIRKYDNGSLELVAHYALGKKKNRVVVVNPRYF